MTLLRTLFFFSLLVLAKNLSAEPKPDPFVPVTHPQAPGTTPSPAPTEGPANSGSIDNLDSFIQALEANADFNQARSKCASGVSFKNGKRVGRMSPGYFYGMMLTFAKTVCKVKDSSYGSGDKYADTLLAQAGQSTQKDTFLHKDYKESLKGDPLIQNYSLLLSLGMLESGGMYNEGIDRTANNTDGITTEAGLFQVSYNSVNQYQVPREIYNDLMRK